MNKNFTVVLYEPEIPQNVGTIMRMCACLDLDLILIEPLGFVLEDRNFKRSKLDYECDFERISSFNKFDQKYKSNRKILFSPHSSVNVFDFEFLPGDFLFFGRESSGVEPFVAETCDAIVSIPMGPRARSLNLAMSVAMGASLALKSI